MKTLFLIFSYIYVCVCARLAFQSVYNARRNKLYIFRQSPYIVYIQFLSMYVRYVVGKYILVLRYHLKYRLTSYEQIIGSLCKFPVHLLTSFKRC